MTATTVGSAVATRDAGPVKFMWSKRSHLDIVLPRSVDVEAFLGTAAGALYGNAELMKAATLNPDSLMIALMECATLGHLPGTEDYYLTPRPDKGKPRVLGIEGYRGVIERMYRSGAVAKVVVREVCARDKFRYVEGEDDHPFHSFGGGGSTGADFFGASGSRDRGEMVGVYAYAQLTTGAYSRVVILTRDDVLAARAAGGYKGDEDKFSPWNRLDGGPNHPELRGRSMWLKTGAKRLEPWVPTSAEYRREQLRASTAAAGAGPRPVAALPPDDGIVDAEVVEETQQPQPEPAALEQPSQRRSRRQQGPPEVVPWPGDAQTAPPATPASTHAATTQAAGEPQGDPGGAQHHYRDGDPRGIVLAELERLGVHGEAIGDTLTQLAQKPLASVESLNHKQAAWFAERLPALASRDDLEALLATGEVRDE